MTATLDPPVEATWREAPPPAPEASRPRSWVLAVVLTAWIGLAGPTVRTLALPAAPLTPFLALAVPGLVAVAAVPRRLWPLRLAVAAIAAAALVPSQGEVVAVWAAVGALLAAWVVWDRRPLPWLPSGEASLAGVAVLTGVATWAAREEETWAFVLPLALSLALPVLGTLGGGALHRIGARVGAAAGHLVSAVVFTVASLVWLPLAWLGHRITRRDPLAAHRGWEARERRPAQAAQPWAPDALPRRRAGNRQVALALLIVGVVLAGAVVWSRREPPVAGEAGSASARLGVDGPTQDAEWYGDYQEDIAWVLDERVALRPLEVYRLRDVETRTVTIEDRYRRSWEPPACDCDPVTVWLYGGSAAFGLEQRDEHTVASALARLADEEGIALEVANRGMPAQAHWRASTRFAWDVLDEAPPDLVVFLDGAEEVATGLALADEGLGDVLAPYDPLLEDLYDEIQADNPEPLPSQPAVVDFQGRPTREADLTAGEIAVERYLRSLQMSDDTAAALGIPVLYAWQPLLLTSPGGESGADRAEAAAAARRGLSDEVLDLTEAVDQDSLVGGEHLTEAGASAVAARLLDALRPRIEAIVDGEPPS